MAEQTKSDILMQFVLNGRPVLAECAAQMDPKDKFMLGIFNPSGDAADYSDFFQVTKFDFGFAVTGSEDAGGGASKAARAGTTHPSQKDKDKDKKKSKSGQFNDWLKAGKGVMEDVPYKVAFEPFSFTRVIDAASPIFFQSCCNIVTFDNATLVKRLSVDSYVNGKSVSMPMSFLRMKFTKVLLTSVAWDDGEVLNESCKFVCQHFMVEYKKQDADGVMQPQPAAEWDWKTDSQTTSK